MVFAVASGMALGKEGPSVHIATCFGEVLSQFFDKFAQNEALKREILSAASAAGVSVAFGAPIGGVLFSLEEVSYYFPHRVLWLTFLCSATGALVLQKLDPFGTGKLVLFATSYTSTWHDFELIPFAMLAVAGGLLGALFIKINIRICRFRRTTALRFYPVTEVLVNALLTALISFNLIYTKLDAAEVVASLFAECSSSVDAESIIGELCNPSQSTNVILSLLVAAVIKFVLFLFTLGTKVPCGSFIPSLAYGACLGRAVGIGMQVLQTYVPSRVLSPDVFSNHSDWAIFAACTPGRTCITPGFYALIGAVAGLGGVSRMTVSLVVITFELTGQGGFELLIPLIMTVLIAKSVGDLFCDDM